MINKQNLVVSALVALVVALGVTYFLNPEANIGREIVREIKEQVGATPTISDISNGPICIEGYCEWPKAGACNNASSTIFGIQNPFGATSTVSMVRVYGKNGTTTIDILVGTSSTPAIFAGKATTTAPTGFTPSLIATALIGSSSSFYIHNNMNWDTGSSSSVASPDVTSARSSYSGYNSQFSSPGFRNYFSDLASIGNAATTSVQGRIIVGPYEYVTGLATSSYLYADAANLNGNQGVTNASNEFSCNYAIKFER